MNILVKQEIKKYQKMINTIYKYELGYTVT